MRPDKPRSDEPGKVLLARECNSYPLPVGLIRPNAYHVTFHSTTLAASCLSRDLPTFPLRPAYHGEGQCRTSLGREARGWAAKLGSQSLFDLFWRKPGCEHGGPELVPHLLGLCEENGPNSVVYLYRSQIDGHTSFEVWRQPFP